MVNAGLKANLSLRELKSKLSAGPSSFLHTLRKNQLRRPPKGSRPPSSISLPVIEGCASYYKGLSSVVPWAKSFFSIRENMKQQENEPFIKAVPANFLIFIFYATDILLPTVSQGPLHLYYPIISSFLLIVTGQKLNLNSTCFLPTFLSSL